MTRAIATKNMDCGKVSLGKLIFLRQVKHKSEQVSSIGGDKGR